VDEIAPGLWRWTAPHPAWLADAEPDSPEDWERDLERGIVSHGEPVLDRGTAALRACLRAET
jgi:hypothetical protein